MVASGRYPLFIRRGGRRVDPAGVTLRPVPCGTGLISRLPAGHGSLGLKNYASKKVLAVLRHRPETVTPDTQIKPPTAKPEPPTQGESPATPVKRRQPSPNRSTISRRASGRALYVLGSGRNHRVMARGVDLPRPARRFGRRVAPARVTPCAVSVARPALPQN